MNTKELAKNLKLLIGNKSITAVAKAIGISRQTLSRYMNCKSKIRLINLIKIANYFGTTLDWLIGLKQ